MKCIWCDHDLVALQRGSDQILYENPCDGSELVEHTRERCAIGIDERRRRDPPVLLWALDAAREVATDHPAGWNVDPTDPNALILVSAQAMRALRIALGITPMRLTLRCVFCRTKVASIGDGFFEIDTRGVETVRHSADRCGLALARRGVVAPGDGHPLPEGNPCLHASPPLREAGLTGTTLICPDCGVWLNREVAGNPFGRAETIARGAFEPIAAALGALVHASAVSHLTSARLHDGEAVTTAEHATAQEALQAALAGIPGKDAAEASAWLTEKILELARNCAREGVVQFLDDVLFAKRTSPAAVAAAMLRGREKREESSNA